MSVTLYAYAHCEGCRKAMRFLGARGVTAK
jgi:arsenate reductase-like glutaredoxin family protein